MGSMALLESATLKPFAITTWYAWYDDQTTFLKKWHLSLPSWCYPGYPDFYQSWWIFWIMKWDVSVARAALQFESHCGREFHGSMICCKHTAALVDHLVDSSGWDCYHHGGICNESQSLILTTYYIVRTRKVGCLSGSRAASACKSISTKSLWGPAGMVWL